MNAEASFGPLPTDARFPKRMAFLGGFEPRHCGIATFTTDLCNAVSAASPDAECFAAAVNDRVEGYPYPPRVKFELLEKNLDSYRRAADFLNFNNVDLLCVQHEFGIYGGPAGSHLLALLKEVRMPVVTTLHTVLRSANMAQCKVMMDLVRYSDRLVVMAERGADMLREIYAVPSAKLDVIPHGIPDLPFADSAIYKAQLGVEGRRVLLTFGLLGPGKGIEQAIEALPQIVRRHPDVVYLVLGATHPNLVARDGESYRLGLERLAEDRGVKDHVIFYNRFVSQEDLGEFICATDIYVTPYLNEMQITSGTLAYVFGAGKAVVSTPYWHATELLADGRGKLVPFRDPSAIAAAVCELLESPELMERIGKEAYRMGRDMIWPAVASRYLESFRRAGADHKAAPRKAFAEWTLASRPSVLPPLRLDHLMQMTDGTGIFQHAIFSVPNYAEGYCSDDNARAYILCNLLATVRGEPVVKELEKLTTTYLAFLAGAFNAGNGRFRNFMSHGRDWLEDAGSEDSHGRVLWALGVGVGRTLNPGHQRLCTKLFEQALTALESFTSPRAWAFALLGIHEYLRRFPANTTVLSMRRLLTCRLVKLWQACATEDWPWFESSVTYENARLCQALILSGQWLPDPEALQIGLQSLRWLASIQRTKAGHFRPIGSNGFYPRDGNRADFDQQPVEAQAMIAAFLEAQRATDDPQWAREARWAFEWFLGRNDLGLSLYDPGTGGCGDGLHAEGVSENQGAESSLAFHLSMAEISHAGQPIPESLLVAV